MAPSLFFFCCLVPLLKLKFSSSFLSIEELRHTELLSVRTVSVLQKTRWPQRAIKPQLSQGQPSSPSVVHTGNQSSPQPARDPAFVFSRHLGRGRLVLLSFSVCPLWRTGGRDRWKTLQSQISE